MPESVLRKGRIEGGTVFHQQKLIARYQYQSSPAEYLSARLFNSLGTLDCEFCMFLDELQQPDKSELVHIAVNVHS